MAIAITENIFWVGAIDWNIRAFHGHTYSTLRGTTYNAYLILDDHISLVDAVHAPFGDEMIEKIRQIVAPEKIEYIIIGSRIITSSHDRTNILFCGTAAVTGL